MGLTYDGITYRSLEEQVRYDAEQIQILKQADVAINENLQTVNENLQTVNTELNGKLTAPTTPTAESAVTMLADGTVGTKPLSEIGGGGGKLYSHRIHMTSGEENLYFNIISSKNTKVTRKEINNLNPCVARYMGGGGDGVVSLDMSYGEDTDTLSIVTVGVIKNGSNVAAHNNFLTNPNYTDTWIEL